MIDFGYSIHTDRQIDFDKTDKTIAAYVRSKEPGFDMCIACGSCTATCSANKFTEMNFRKIILLAKRGMVSQLKNELDKCMFCGKCQLACPRGIQTRNIIMHLRTAIN